MVRYRAGTRKSIIDRTGLWLLRRGAIWAVCGVILSGLAGCGGKAPTGSLPIVPPGSDPGPAQGDTTQFFARNMMYRIDDAIVATMPELIADLRVRRPGQPLVPSNLEDFNVHIHTCQMGLDDASITALMNRYAFAAPDSPIKDVKVEHRPGRMTITGTLWKGLPIPFSCEGPLDVSGDGRIVLRPDKVVSAGLSVKGLLDLLGLEMATLINSASPGIRIEGNNFFIDPQKLVPPPRITGFVANVRVEQGRLILGFDDRVRRSWPELAEPGYRNTALLWGGNMLINNHLVFNVKFQMVDTTQQDPMWIYMPAYREQLAAGFVVADHGYTISYVPDVRGTRIDLPRYRRGS